MRSIARSLGIGGLAVVLALSGALAGGGSVEASRDFLNLLSGTPPSGPPFVTSPDALQLSGGKATIEFTFRVSNRTHATAAVPVQFSVHHVLTYHGRDVSDGQPGSAGITFPRHGSVFTTQELVGLPQSVTLQVAPKGAPPQVVGFSQTVTSCGYFQVDVGVHQGGTHANLSTGFTRVLGCGAGAPRIAGSLTDLGGNQPPSASGSGWYGEPLAVHFDCSDSLSQVVTCGPDRILTDGARQMVVGRVVDAAGFTASTRVGPVSIDSTPPRITGAPSGAPNAGGWFSSPVSVRFTCSDALSGIAACPGPARLLEGPAQVATGVASDRAGNTASAQAGPFAVDLTPPTIAFDGVADGGVYDNSASADILVADALSGVDPASVTTRLDGAPYAGGDSIDTPGPHTLLVKAADLAGNQAQARVSFRVVSVVGRPSIRGSLVGPDGQRSRPSSTGWHRTPVTATFVCTDPKALITSCGPDLPLGDGVHADVSGTAVDVLGYTSTTNLGTVQVDATPPSVVATASQAPNASGWVNAPVTVSFACSDATSGVALCPDPITLSAEGPAQMVFGRGDDRAGNSTIAMAGPFNIDLTPPRISVSGIQDGGAYTGDLVPQVSIDDSGSGVDPGSVSMTLDGDPYAAGATIGGIGAHTLSIAAADRAGNTATWTAHFSLQHLTEVRWNGDSTAPYHATAVLGVTVVDATLGQPVEGASVALAAAGMTCTAVSDTAGHAECSQRVNAPSGTYPRSATFAGDSLHSSASDSGQFTVVPIALTLSFLSPASQPAGSVQLEVALTTADGQPVGGRTVQLGDGSNSYLATTDSSGRAVAHAELQAGKLTISAATTADPYYGSASASQQLTITPATPLPVAQAPTFFGITPRGPVALTLTDIANHVLPGAGSAGSQPEPPPVKALTHILQPSQHPGGIPLPVVLGALAALLLGGLAGGGYLVYARRRRG